jgi:DNA invertase Pin-like site-specific DNA recombinase
MKECANGKVDMIYTKSISRFARNTVDFLETMRMLKTLGVTVIFENEHIDTSQPISEFAVTLFAAYAQEESESKSSNIRWGILQKFKSGAESYVNRPCFGYDKGEHHLEINTEEAQIVRQIFQKYLSGESLKSIAVYLENNRILSPKGGTKWSSQTVKNILQNEKYTGNVLLQKTYVESFFTSKQNQNKGDKNMYLVEGCHTAIVTKNEFEEVQKLLEKRSNVYTDESGKAIRKSNKYTSNNHVSGKVICGECGRSYRRITRHDSVIVWRCANRVEHGRNICKNSPTIKEAELIKMFDEIQEEIVVK